MFRAQRRWQICFPSPPGPCLLCKVPITSQGVALPLPFPLPPFHTAGENTCRGATSSPQLCPVAGPMEPPGTSWNGLSPPGDNPGLSSQWPPCRPPPQETQTPLGSIFQISMSFFFQGSILFFFLALCISHLNCQPAGLHSSQL